MGRDYANAMLGVMDEAMHEARHEGGYRRIEAITGRRKPRDWSDEEKARIVCESAEPDANISAVARRHGVNRGLLNAWRREAGVIGRREGKARQGKARQGKARQGLGSGASVRAV